MNLTCAYAIAIIDYLYGKRGYIPAREISRETKIPYAYLQKLLMLLRSKGYITAKRGVGIKLKKKPIDINVLKFLEDLMINHAPGNINRNLRLYYDVLKEKYENFMAGFALDEVIEDIRQNKTPQFKTKN